MCPYKIFFNHDMFDLVITVSYCGGFAVLWFVFLRRVLPILWQPLEFRQCG